MRVTFSQIVVMLILTGISRAEVSVAQNALERDISLNVVNESLVAVLKQIEEKVSVRFIYSKNFVPTDNKVSISVSNEKLSVVLDKLLEPLNINYEAIKDRIVLKKSKGGETHEPEALDEQALNLKPEAPVSEFQISGTVTADTGEPLPGVNVLVKGTTNGTVTDGNGKYALNLNDGSETLVFSFIGYMTQEVAVNSQSVLNVTMTADVQALQEVVVVGYGEQKKVTVTGSVVAVEGKDLQKSPAVDLSNSFAGRLPGIVAVQTSGEPGFDGSTITIRGKNTLGNNDALIVIDGIPDRDGGFGRLSPQEIESISVLKDASSAIYGARAANGVILITTKRGKSGKPQISYDFNQGWSQATRIPAMADAVEYTSIMNEIPIYKVIPANEWSTAWQSIQDVGTYTSPTNGQTVNANYSPADVQLFKDGSDPWGHPNEDWFKTAFKTWAPMSRHNLQISGGSDNTKYMASVGYVYQDAYYKNSATYYEQYNARINLDANVSKYISTSIGIMAREEQRNFPTQTAGSIFRMLMRGRPTEPEVWPNGLPGPDIENGQNPYVITTNATGYDATPVTYLQSNGRIDITNPWISGLKLTLMGSLDKSIHRRKRWETPWYLYTWDKVSYESDGVTPALTKALRSTFTDPRLTLSTRNVLNTNATALLTYDKSFGDHTIGFLVGVTREKFQSDFFEAYRRDYISGAIDQPFFGGETQTVTGGNDNVTAYDRARFGTYGRLTYNYKEKYLVELVWRRDGSSFFPEAHRFGFFPGVLLGWNISNEEFFSNNISFINFLKIRGSYGEMGNDQVYYNNRLQEYAFLAAYTGGTYPINNQVVTTVTEQVVANPNFTWERARNSNIGLDGTMLDGKIDFTVDVFYNKRDQILIQKQGSTPESSGISPLLPPENNGKVSNKGIDFKIGYNNKIGDLEYSVSVNGGYYKNKVVFKDEVPGNPEYQWETGKPLGAYLAYIYDGVFRNEEEVNSETLDYSQVTPNLIPGDMKFKDVNNDGVIDGDDRVRLDKTDVPNFNFGLSINLAYKNFDLSVLFQGATGSLLPFGTESGDIGNYLQYSYDHRWSIDNPSSVDPRLAIRGDTYYTGGNYGRNTYNLFNKNYVRLKNIEVGYNLPTAILGKVGLSNARVYVNALNLITWDKYKIFDPETTSGSGQYYPQARVINTGVRLTF